MQAAPHPYRWRIAILLGLGVLVNFFDRVNLSVSYDAITREFGLSTVAFGYLLSAYSWTYAVCQIPAGALLDRFGVKLVGRCSSFLWSIASFASALSPGLRGCSGARLLLGVGEAPTFPGNAKAIGNWFPENERGLATACFDSAAKFASAIGVPIMGLLLVHFGWRWTFVPPVRQLLLLPRFYCHLSRPAARCRYRRSQPHPASPSRRWSGSAKLSDSRSAPQPTTTVSTCCSRGSPSYLAFSLHLNVLQSAWYTSIPWLIAACSDLVIGGWLVDALIRRGRDASTRTANRADWRHVSRHCYLCRRQCYDDSRRCVSGSAFHSADWPPQLP